jgi:uncharacterized protein with HEPN domain
MLDAAHRVLRYAHGRTRADLDTDELLVDGLVRCIEIIGEAASRVTPERREREPGIPWPAIISMRRRVVHEYFRANLDVVWQTVTDDVPRLIPELERALAQGPR